MVLVRCKSISWESVRTIVWYIYANEKPEFVTKNLGFNYIRLLYYLCKGTDNVRFLALMDSTKHLLCWDKRDKIIALLSLVDRAENYLKIEPDYNKSVS